VLRFDTRHEGTSENTVMYMWEEGEGGTGRWGGVEWGGRSARRMEWATSEQTASNTGGATHQLKSWTAATGQLARTASAPQTVAGETLCCG
jgi:hypothetical protein